MKSYEDRQKEGREIESQIISNVRNFIRNDFNHENPNAILISIDLFTSLRYSIEFHNQNMLSGENFTFFGIDIFVIHNKREYLNVCRI